MCAEVTNNSVIKNDLEMISAQVSQGLPFWESLQKLSYISPTFVSLVRIGEETGNLSETINQCDIYFMAEYKVSIQRLSKLIEPIITIILGVLLAIIMIAIILPTFELATAI